MDIFVRILYMNFLGYSHLFMSIRISHHKDEYISVDQARYDISAVEKYLNSTTLNIHLKFHKTTLPHDMIFIKKMLIQVMNK